MLALQVYRDGLCPNCSGVLADTTHPDNEGRYKADLPVQCFRCLAVGLSHDAYRDQPQPLSYLHMVPPKPR